MEIEKLDQIWREIIFKIPIVANMHEFLILKYLLLHQKEIEHVKDYPYIYAWEYPLNPEEAHKGKIDLILSKDGQTAFLIVELKYMADMFDTNNSGKKNRERRKKLELQIEENKKAFQELKPGANIESIGITNDNLGLEFDDYCMTEWEKIEKDFGYKNKSTETWDFIVGFNDNQ